MPVNIMETEEAADEKKGILRRPKELLEPVTRPVLGLKLFSCNANRPLADKIAEVLGVPLGRADVERFADGEINVHVKENVRGRDCYVIQPTCRPVNEHLMELLVMVDALRRASAGRITAVIP